MNRKGDIAFNITFEWIHTSSRWLGDLRGDAVEQLAQTRAALGKVVVVGLPHERWTEAITAVVVPKPGKQIDERALLDDMRKLIDRYKVPKAVIVADQLPRTSTGKIQKNVIRKNFSGYYTGETV